MGSKKKPQPRLVFADESGQIFDHPELLMVTRRGNELGLPRPDEITPLPEDSEFFMLPGRAALGLDPETGQLIMQEEDAMAAFVSPAHTLTGHAAYAAELDAPTLPLLAYAAIGYADGRFWVTAKRVDQDRRQEFSRISQKRIEDGANTLMRKYPDNRLVRHLASCALTSGCPAARNLSLGRYECPLPTARTCNARCVGCISLQPEDSGFPSPQERIAFTPTADEIVQIMRHHATREKRPVFSFGQGCEGEPLTEAELLAEAARSYRSDGGHGTINVNTNGSLPDTMAPLAEAGFDSIRVSINSLRRGPYDAYYRPKGYSFDDVRETIRQAKANGLFVSLNFLYFPGISDTESELEALMDFVQETRLDYMQLRNLNMDPELYIKLMESFEFGPSMGFMNFRKRLKKSCDWLEFGYFNPIVSEGKKVGAYP